MTDGIKFFVGVLIAVTIGAIALSSAVGVKHAQENTITKAEQKADQLLQ